jgi:hypothetical protein
MEYGYRFDDESPRFALNTLWFLLGVMVFAFSVLIMTAIVSVGGNDSYYLNVREQPVQQTKPRTNATRVTPATTAADNASTKSTTAPARHNR